MRLTEISLEQEFWSYSEFKLNKDWVSTSLGFLGKMEIRGAVCGRTWEFRVPSGHTGP